METTGLTRVGWKTLTIMNNQRDAINIFLQGDTITVNANVKLAGNHTAGYLATGLSYGDLALSGIKDLWEGKYWMDGLWVELKMDLVQSAGNRRNSVTINIDATQIVTEGANAYNEKRGSWSKGGSKYIDMYAYKPDYEGSGLYSASHFKNTSAHEFGHSMGIWDFYETSTMYGVPESIVARDDLMRDSASGRVYSKTVSVMLDAMWFNKSQELRVRK